MSEQKCVQITGTEFDEWAPFTAMRLAPGEYEIRSKSGAIDFQVFGAAFAEWVCLKLNASPSVDEAARPCSPYGDGDTSMEVSQP